MTRLLGVLTLALSVPATSLAGPQDGSGEGKSDGAGGRKALIGQYKITAGEKDGLEIPAERLNNSVTITEDTFAVVDRDKKELYAAKYKLKRKQGEKGLFEIDMESTAPQEGAKAVGLLKRDGKEVWLIYALGENRPENFEKTIRGQHLFKMTRTTKPAADAPPEKEENDSGT